LAMRTWMGTVAATGMDRIRRRRGSRPAGPSSDLTGRVAVPTMVPGVNGWSPKGDHAPLIGALSPHRGTPPWQAGAEEDEGIGAVSPKNWYLRGTRNGEIRSTQAPRGSGGRRFCRVRLRRGKQRRRRGQQG